MPDLLTHALAAYVLATVLSWRYDWLTPPYVTATMAGAFVPDIVKIGLFVHPQVIVDLTGLPFTWQPLHYLGGVLLSVLVGVLVVVPRERLRVFVLLGVGAASHLVLDGMLRTASGRSFPVFWPLSQYRPPTPGLYLSTDPWPALVALTVAAVVWAATRYRRDRID